MSSERSPNRIGRKNICQCDYLVRYQCKQKEKLTKKDINEIAKAVYEIIKPEIYEIIKYEMDEIREDMGKIRNELNVIKRSRGTVIIAPRPSHVFHSGETDNRIEELRNEWFRYK